MPRDASEPRHTVTITALVDERRKASVAQALSQLTKDMPIERIENRLGGIKPEKTLLRV